MNKEFKEYQKKRELAYAASRKTAVWEGLLVDAAAGYDEIGLRRLVSMSKTDPLICNDKNYRVNRWGLLVRQADVVARDVYCPRSKELRRATGDEAYIPGLGWEPTYKFIKK